MAGKKRKVIIDGKEKSIVTNAKTVGELIDQLNLSRQEVIAKVDGKVRDEFSPLGKKVELIRVVFGG